MTLNSSKVPISPALHTICTCNCQLMLRWLMRLSMISKLYNCQFELNTQTTMIWSTSWQMSFRMRQRQVMSKKLMSKEERQKCRESSIRYSTGWSWSQCFFASFRSQQVCQPTYTSKRKKLECLGLWDSPNIEWDFFISTSPWFLFLHLAFLVYSSAWLLATRCYSNSICFWEAKLHLSSRGLNLD